MSNSQGYYEDLLMGKRSLETYEDTDEYSFKQNQKMLAKQRQLKELENETSD